MTYNYQLMNEPAIWLDIEGEFRQITAQRITGAEIMSLIKAEIVSIAMRILSQRVRVPS